MAASRFLGAVPVRVVLWCFATGVVNPIGAAASRLHCLCDVSSFWR